MHPKTKTTYTIEKLLDLKKNQILKVDHEYQRGLAWKPYQQQFFIDSIFRNYPIPAFYFHHKVIGLGGEKNNAYSIIDGQQRINAIYEFVKGDFPLLSPDKFKFPNFLEDEKVSWAGKHFADLSEKDQKNLLLKRVVIYMIKTEDKNKIRDLFIRLQGGVSLSAQDKRDSWPGNFTKFVLEAGGKLNTEWPDGWKFFKEIPKISNASKRRAFVAQCYMLFQKKRDENRFIDIKLSSIDRYYSENVDFDNKSDNKKRFESICKRLYKIFEKNSIQIPEHYVIHLILFMDSIMDKAIPASIEQIPKALHKFKKRVDEARKAFEDENKVPDFKYKDYHDDYGHYTRSSSDTARSIERRHEFFEKKMNELAKITYKDQKRILSSMEKEDVYFRDKQKCQVCRMNGNEVEIKFPDADFHHVKPHAEGGDTSIDNHVTVHKNCHPKGLEKETRFREWWNENKPKKDKNDAKKNQATKSKKLPPNGTKLRYVNRKYPCEGEIIEGKIHITINGSNQIFYNFTKAAKAVLGKTSGVNGWRYWEIKTPNSDEWQRADRWRNSSNP